MTVLKRHPVDRPSISQLFAAVSDRGSHLGIDYRPDYPGQKDFPVYAAHDGFVVFSRDTGHDYGNPWEQIPNNGNNGRSIIIQAVAPHQACATSYNHLGTRAVEEGQWVTAGTFIGYMGWTGFVLPADPNGTHLHFELFIDYGNGQYPEGTYYGRVNPLDYFAIETVVPVAPGASGDTSIKTPAATPKEWDEMASKEEIRAVVREELRRERTPLVKAIWNHLIWGRTQPDPGKNENNSITAIQELANVRTAQINSQDATKQDVVDAIQDNVVTVEVRGREQ